MRMRKLITMATLSELEDRVKMGVPLTRAIRDLEIPMSTPAVSKLLTQWGYTNARTDDMVDVILDSLFPHWLDYDGQEQPPGTIYQGYFPFGRWL